MRDDDIEFVRAIKCAFAAAAVLFVALGAFAGLCFGVSLILGLFGVVVS